MVKMMALVAAGRDSRNSSDEVTAWVAGAAHATTDWEIPFIVEIDVAAFYFRGRRGEVCGQVLARVTLRTGGAQSREPGGEKRGTVEKLKS